MALTITARHCELSLTVRQRVTKKVDKLTRYVPSMTGAHLVVTREKSRYDAELVVTARRLRTIGKAQEMDSASAVEMAVARVEQQLRKQHARRQDLHLREAHAWAAIRKSASRPPLPKIPLASDDALVRTSLDEAKPMSAQDAVMELRLKNQEFLAFRSDRTNQLNVVYKRPDGRYGLIEL